MTFLWLDQNIQVPNLLQQLPFWWLSKTSWSCCWDSGLANFSFQSTMQHVLSQAAGNQRWEYIFLSHDFLSSPEQHILKKSIAQHAIFPSQHIHNSFFVSPFIEYFLNPPFSMKFSFCQIYFTVPVLSFVFPSLSFLVLLITMFHFKCFALWLNNLRENTEVLCIIFSVEKILSGHSLFISRSLFFSRFWFFQLLFIHMLISENLEMLLILTDVRFRAF